MKETVIFNIPYFKIRCVKFNSPCSNINHDQTGIVTKEIIAKKEMHNEAKVKWFALNASRRITRTIHITVILFQK
ncbi:hypothetical protein BK143_03000 [Paenibacillus peoriae]|nr:hypothetical protein PPYC2_18275 [Paenibacillus polymyxa]OMF75353.1 hypothetical protein BK143_03000 [Paenibacillus peoriae]